MTTPDAPRSSGWFTPFLMVACIALGATVVVLVRTNARIRAEHSATAGHLAAAEARMASALAAASVRVGEPMGPLMLESAEGSRALRRFDGGERSTVMMVVSAACDVCAEAGPVWATVLAGPREGCDAIVVSIDALPRGDAGGLAALGVQKFGAIDARASTLGGLRLIPATILVGPDGIVDGVWYGVLDEDAMREVSAALADGPG